MKEMAREANNDVVVDYRNRINQASAFIQNNISRQITLNEVAAAANFSPFHFHRIFSAFTGETIFEYLIRTRMKKAVELLMSGHPSNQIAFETGYQTTAAFAKAFKRTFGCSPTTYKRKFLSDRITYAKEMKGQAFAHHQPAIKELPALPILYVTRKGRVNENYNKAADEAFGVLRVYLDNNNVDTSGILRLGIIRDMEGIDSGECRFEACFSLIKDPAFSDSTEVNEKMIDAGKWAVFRHHGAYNSLWQTWNWIYRYWYPSASVAFRDADPFEVYLNSPRQTKPADLLTDIHIPIS
jgi:AraC family transcriptional regulator